MLKWSGKGMERIAASDKRVAQIKAAAKPPASCGPDVIAAPARGPFVAVDRLAMTLDGRDSNGQEVWSASPSGYGHRSSIRAADVFDLMTMAARRRREPDPLTPGQIAQARLYRSLFEQREAGGVKLSSLDGRVSGGERRDFMDAFMSVSRQVEGMQRRIGTGSSMQVRRVRPSARGTRRSIPDRVIVDMICLGDHSVSEVLRAHGWAVYGDTRKALIAGLSGALDRMIGYRG